MSERLNKQKRIRRNKIWRHNALLGRNAMAIAGMRAIQKAETTTAEAKKEAKEIEVRLHKLAPLLRKRDDTIFGELPNA